MSNPIGGTCFFKINGIQLDLSGEDLTVAIQSTTKTSVIPGYFKETDTIPKIEGTFVVPKDFPYDLLMQMQDGVITVELRSGRVACLFGAYVVGAADINASGGTCKLTFEGSKGEWL